MASVVHISEAGLSDAKSLLELARGAEAVIIDGDGESFRLSLEPGRTVAEILRDTGIFEKMNALDEDWSKDLEEIIASRKNEPDPWAR
jgi:hypothetical protein